MTKDLLKELLIIIVASVILGLAIAFPDASFMLSASIYMLIILLVNNLTKKIFAYYLEADLKINFWSWYQYWFKRESHFKKPIPMFWLAPVLSLISRGTIWWLPIIEFDIKPRTERVSKRHGLYRFSEMTDWHVSVIATMGIIANLILAVILYFSGFEFFAKLSIYYSAWLLLPISNLDGTRILAGSRVLWFTVTIITFLALIWTLMIF